MKLHLICACILLNLSLTNGRATQLPSAPEVGSASAPSLASAAALTQNGDFIAAESRTRAVIAVEPNSAKAHYLLGYILNRESRAAESLSEYTTAARLQTPTANDLAVVALDYVLMKDYAAADTWLSKATTWQPTNALYWYYLGRVKYRLNAFEGSIAAFTKALALEPRNVRDEYNMGLCLEGLGQMDQAEKAYRLALQWQQDAPSQDAQPFYNLGVLLASENRAEEALIYLEKAVALDGQNPAIREKLGMTENSLKKLPEAQRDLEIAVSRAPRSAALHFQLGRIYQKRGLSTQAKQQFDLCAELNQTHSDEDADIINLPSAPTSK
jgi:tetratricopeptide (TPR) repeat protein